MAAKASCPKCSGKLLWNGTAMTCITCTYVAPVDSPKTKSEKKFPMPKKSKER